MGLAMLLNGLMASPAFADWIQGQPMEMDRLLFGPSGKPQVSILYIAHLSDAEKQFFITLLLEQVVSWMRAQSGTTSLRALVYMDEIFGFMPLLDDEPYPVHARAVDNVSARVVTREALQEAVIRDPGLALLLIKLLSKRLREAFLQTERLSIRGVVNKVAMALNSLMPESVQERAPTILTLSVSSRDFAGLYGLSPESFSRGITTLVQEEVILRLGHNSFQVLDVARLQQYALPHLL